MSNKNWHPLKEVNTLRHQMNNLFDEIIHTNAKKTANRVLSSIPQVDNATWEPAIEIKETDSSLVLQAQVAGIETQGFGYSCN